MPATHPFLIDQMPYILSRVSSGFSVHSTTSTYTASSDFGSSTTSSSSSASVSSSPCSSASSSSSSSSYYTISPSRTAASSIPIPSSREDNTWDLACFAYMQATDESDHTFGSVASRGSMLSAEERSVIRAVAAQAERGQVENGKGSKEEKRKRRTGRLF